ncbi:MAG: DUF4468 domain-containing protein [Treponema sp.]|jgi:hypothetical protein|nr:DUF4468 domain-containing protein [Treponema sp.]
MNKLFGFCLVVVFCFSACVSTVEVLTEPPTYDEVVDVAGISASDLFTKVNLWSFDTFRDADSVIQFSDKENRIIKGKYVSDLKLGGYQQYLTTTTITVEVKDEKYRVSFTNPTYREYVTNGYGMRFWGFKGGYQPATTQKIADGIKNEWLTLAKQLKESVQKDTSW